jgi:hypothetical protein|eukprot:6578020-Prymnesium_polylepis.2
MTRPEAQRTLWSAQTIVIYALRAAPAHVRQMHSGGQVQALPLRAMQHTLNWMPNRLGSTQRHRRMRENA